MRSPSAPRLDALTGARFFAALHVLLFHYGAPLFVALPAWMCHVRETGYVAVSFFFVLSGFVLAFHHAEPAASGTLDVRAFWVHRFSRIYPLYALALVSLVPLAISPVLGATTFGTASRLAKAVTFVAHAGLLQAWFPRLVMSWNLPGWSICAEAFFYATFPFIAARIARRLGARQLLACLALLWLTSVGIALGIMTLVPGEVTPSTRGLLDLVKFDPLLRLPEFVFGICLARLFRLRGPVRASGALVVAAVLVIVATLAVSPAIPLPLQYNGFLLPAFGALVYGLAAGRGVVARALSTRPLIALGDASYGLYILQFPVAAWAAVLLPQAAGTAAFTAALVAGSVALSLVTARVFERPMQRWLRHVLLQRPAAAPVRLAGG